NRGFFCDDGLRTLDTVLAALAWTFGFAFCVTAGFASGFGFTGAASGPASTSGVSVPAPNAGGRAAVCSVEETGLAERSGTTGVGAAEVPRLISMLTGFGGALLPGPGNVIRSGSSRASAIR